MTGDVIISGASLNDGYAGWTLCGANGEVYRRPGTGRVKSLMRVAKDGSTSLFTLPGGDWPQLFTPTSSGVVALSYWYSWTEGPIYRMFRFDSEANLLTQHRLAIDFHPTMMGATSSGKIVVLGFTPQTDDRTARRYVGVVVDADDQVAKRFDFIAETGDQWIPVAPRMEAGDGVVYVIAKSGASPQVGVATISESGLIAIAKLDVPADSNTRHRNEWLFGPGVAVEVYHYVGERPRVIDRFDEYDLATGTKIATRTALPAGFAFGCYLGDEVSMLAHSAHVDAARHLAPDALRLVTIKLQ